MTTMAADARKLPDDRMGNVLGSIHEGLPIIDARQTLGTKQWLGRNVSVPRTI